MRGVSFVGVEEPEGAGLSAAITKALAQWTAVRGEKPDSMAWEGQWWKATAWASEVGNPQTLTR